MLGVILLFSQFSAIETTAFNIKKFINYWRYRLPEIKLEKKLPPAFICKVMGFENCQFGYALDYFMRVFQDFNNS